MKSFFAHRLVYLFIGLIGFVSLLIVKGRADEHTDFLMWRSMAMAFLMIYLWLFELIPIYVTALLPLLMGGVLGIGTSKEIASCYGDSNIYLFLGGFVLAIALEQHGVHLQIARRIIGFVGNTKSRLLLGFIVSTGCISMWISNTATALMMLPMAMAIVSTLPIDQQNSRFSTLLTLSIAYAANIGGVGTLVGSPPNLIMAAIINGEPYNAHIDFLSWAKIGMPVAIVFLFLLYVLFSCFLRDERKDTITIDSFESSAWTPSQKRVLIIFACTVFLWMSKGLFASYLGFHYDDLFPAMLGGIALFVVPMKSDQKQNYQPLLRWEATQKIPWGVLLLFGGGIAMAKTLQQHGVFDKIVATFVYFQHLPIVWIVLILATISVFATELISNTALTNIFVPLVAIFALQFGLPIDQLSYAVTIAASWAFMLPIGTPPNAIVFASGKITIKTMVFYGFLLNVVGVLLLTFLCWLLMGE